MKRLLQKPYLLIFCVLIFFTPLVFVSNTVELYEFPKMFFVYFVGGLAIAIFFTDWILHGFKLKKISTNVLTYVVLFAISVIFSVHPYTSVWGYYSRFNDGLISLLIFLGLYFVAINKLKKEDFVVLLKISVFTVIPVSLLAAFQHFEGTARAFSMLGQPNWLAQYILILLPICLYFALNELFWFWGSIFILGFSGVWFAYSTSGLLGVVLSLFALLLIYYKESFFKKNIRNLILLFAICFSIAFSNLGIFRSKFMDIFIDLKKVYALDTISNPANNQVSDPGFIRLGLWKGTLKLITSSVKVFFIGTGPETFPYAFQPFRSLDLNYSSEWDYVFNKPHNYILEIWSESGIFTLISYLALLFFAFKKLSGFMKSSLIGFSVVNLFGWPLVPTTLLFWLWLALSEAKK